MSEQIKAGFYKARGVAGSEQFGTSKGGGEQIAVDLILLELNNRKVTSVLSFAGGARDISINRLRALGWPGTDELRDLDKNEVTVEVKYETYEGETSMKVEIKDGSGGFKFKREMPEQEKRGFMAQLARDAARLDAGRAGPAGGGGAAGYPADWDKPSKGAPKVDLG